MINIAHELYAKMVAEGMPKKEAAKLAQDKTGRSVVTGQPIRTRTEGQNIIANRYPGTTREFTGPYR